MRTDIEKKYLIKAIDAFRRRLIVVSPDFKILAAKHEKNREGHADIIGKYCYEEFHGRTSPCENCAVAESIDKGKHVLRPKPESLIDLNEMPCFYAYPIYSEDKVEAFVSMDFDLPTRGGLEERLQRTSAFLRNLIRSSVDGVIAADKKGQILIFNETASEVFGYSEEEAISGLNMRDIYPDNKAFEVMKMLRDDKYGGKGKLRAYQVDIVGKSGEIIPISLNAAIIYEEGKEIATIGFFHDLREQLRMKEELAKTQIQLLQAEKMSSLGKLAAGVAHQLNNPLGGITLFAKLLLEEYNLEEKAKEDVRRIIKDAKRCRDTVKELLEFTRQTRHFMRPHDVNQALTRTLFLLENQALFQNITIEKDLDPSLPLVHADIQQLNHLFMNIILNAAQAMQEKGKLTVKSYLSADNNHVCVEISDTGPGIPDDILPHIFEPFFTTKEEGKGTGLGLSLAYNIVKNHGGSIRTISKVNEGTTFIIELSQSTRVDQGDEIGEKSG